MINKLRRKFVLLSLGALVLLLAFIVSGILFLNYSSLTREADQVLSLLSKNQGVFPEFGEAPFDWIPHGMSQELPFESRFFSVLVNSKGRVLAAETGSIAAVDAQTAREYAASALKRSAVRGFIDDYRYVRVSESGLTRVTFLDCGRKLAMARNFAVFSLVMSLVGFAIIAAVVIFVSGRFTRPVAESYEKQKRFITDASHEIKTPLTIISANVDVLKMDMGENEGLDEIQRQSKRLTELTNDLVYLSRMEEAGNKPQMIEFPISEVVSGAAAPFASIAASKKIDYTVSVQPLLSMTGDERSISQLVSILLDNAMKYTPEGGRAELKLERQGRKLFLTVTNTTASPIAPDDLRHLFERFYRPDASRNSETGGHGIGLSMAEAIVTAHSGKISAKAPENTAFQITAAFPG